MKQAAILFDWCARGNHKLRELFELGVESSHTKRNSNRRRHATNVHLTLMDESLGSEKEFVAL